MGYNFTVRRPRCKATTSRSPVASRPCRDVEDRIGALERALGHSSVRDYLSIAVSVPPTAGDPHVTRPRAGPSRARAAFLTRQGRHEEARKDLNHLFRLLDVIEVERTSEEVTATARLAFFGLDYLPWEVVWEPIERIKRGYSTQAVAPSWPRASPTRTPPPRPTYLSHIGSGMCSIAEQGLARLGLRKSRKAISDP